ncbi:MAG: elongation factor P hydroxylase [Pseudomonadales bacterium]|nr:elongation factor P hydroxylase [Pseudomonadales bacterium]
MGKQQGRTKAATIPQSVPRVHRSGDLDTLFRATFFHSWGTVLEGGAEEPVYLPGTPHRICYTRDYFRSALHEVAHWCVAGAKRRQQEDYGYWYAPDGRNAEQQAAFTRVEVLPQAYEALFCAACGHDFRVSLDNLNGDGGDESAFARQVMEKAQTLLENGLPERPRHWCEALTAFYGRDGNLAAGLQETFKLPL